MQLWIGGLSALIGAGLLVAAVAVGIETRAFIRDAETTEGVVADLFAGGSHPEVEFTTPSGQKFVSPQSGFIFGYRQGDRVKVLYRTANPDQTACIDSFGALWFSPLLLGTLGFVFVAGGVQRMFS